MAETWACLFQVYQPGRVQPMRVTIPQDATIKRVQSNFIIIGVLTFRRAFRREDFVFSMKVGLPAIPFTVIADGGAGGSATSFSKHNDTFPLLSIFWRAPRSL